MDESRLDLAKKVFLKRIPDFESFASPGDLGPQELDYKRRAVQRTHDTLGPYVAGSAVIATDVQARELAKGTFALTNFLNWRDQQYIDQTLLAEPGAWVEAMTRIVACLRATPDGNWSEPFRQLLDWLDDRKCRVGIAKHLSTYFLFLWDPEHHFSIKPMVFDKFLNDMGEEPLGSGRFTVEAYHRVLRLCKELRIALALWKPSDNVDIHSFAWVVASDWPEPPMPDGGDGGTVIPGPTAKLPALNLILAGPPGTGKTHRLLRHYAAQFADEDGQRYEVVTFHQSYSYEDFVEGIRPVLSGAADGSQPGVLGYKVQDGVFKRLVARAVADPGHAYALFIDEINRANVSNVFGELITLIEPDKRMSYDHGQRKWVGGVQVKLPYTHSATPEAPLFGVPDNLYLIGTMNTADRSIALMDLALRRRFRFQELMPDHSILATKPGPVAGDGAPIYLDRLLDAMNQRIEYLVDRDHTIGHSYLMRVASFEDLVAVFRHEILPLLQEYFYGDWSKIQLVLADLTDEADRDGSPKAHPDAIVQHNIQNPRDVVGLSDDAYVTRRSYEVNEDLTARSFRKVYGGA